MPLALQYPPFGVSQTRHVDGGHFSLGFSLVAIAVNWCFGPGLSMHLIFSLVFSISFSKILSTWPAGLASMINTELGCCSGGRFGDLNQLSFLSFLACSLSSCL